MPKFALFGFTGIDESQGQTNANPDIAASAHNISTRQNRLATATGYEEAIAARVPGKITRIMRFDRRTETGSHTHILAATQDTVYDYRDGVWVPIFEGAASGEWSYVVWEKDMRDLIIMGNGLDPVKKWYGDTDTIEDLEGLPKEDGVTVKFKYLALHKERLWGAGNPLSPDTGYYSRAWDPEKWDKDPMNPIRGGGSLLFPQHDGSIINGLKLVLGDVVLFRPNGITRVFGDTPDNYQQINVRGSIGPVSNESIVDAGTMSWFLCSDGLGYYDGMSTGMVDDRKITSIFDRVTDGAREKANGIMRSNILYMALPLDGATECNAVLEFDTVRQTYMLHEGIPAQDFMFSNAIREQLLIAVDDMVCSMEGKTLNGEPIRAQWVSPWFDLGSQSTIKTITRLYTHGKISLPYELLKGKPADQAMASILLIVETERGKTVKRQTARNNSELALAASMLVIGKRFRVIFENVDGSAFSLDGGIELDVTVRKAGF